MLGVTFGKIDEGTADSKVRERRQAEEKQQPRTTVPVTIMIPAFNEEAVISETLQALAIQSVNPETVVVIDDCSTDRTGEIAKSFGVTVLRTPKNMGSKAHALNYGIQFVESEFTLTIDADVRPASDAVEKVYEFMRSNPDISASSCSFLPKSFKTVYDRCRFVEYMITYPIFRSVQDSYGRVVILAGCFTIYRTGDLKEVGGWPIGTVAEDMDLTWVFYEAGKRARYCPDATAFISEPGNFRLMKKQLTRWNSGWWQVLKLHRKKVNKVPVLREFVLASIADSVLGVIALVLIMMVAMGRGDPLYLLYFGLLDLVLTVAMPCHASMKQKKFCLLLKCLPSYYILRVMTSYFFFQEFVRVWLLGGKIIIFEKGH